ncbi:MAG: cellulose biosynthesis cyclic di-GMP-binding regulatory protein BcsB [Anaerolineales bacterium]|nr:cellulose biosynthesis cyclic di-GMP-binding regulatory protein BcsB [Anaerolineales bacterium]
MTIKLNDQTLEVFPIEAQQLDNYHLSIPLPASAFAPSRSQHLISLEFDASSLCVVPHKATLIIHPTSTVWLNYTQRPLSLIWAAIRALSTSKPLHLIPFDLFYQRNPRPVI